MDVRPSRGKTTCAYHNKAGHSIEECESFGRLSYQKRRQHATDNRLCYNCLGNHRANQCKRNVTCSICRKRHLDLMHADFSSDRHPTPLNDGAFEKRSPAQQDSSQDSRGTPRTAHQDSSRDSRGPYKMQEDRQDSSRDSREPYKTQEDHQDSSRDSREPNSFAYQCPSPDGNQRNNNNRQQHFPEQYGTRCTTVCGDYLAHKSCSKTVPVEIRYPGQGRPIHGLCIIDEQSNRTFIHEAVLKDLAVPEGELHSEEYTVSTLSRISPPIQGYRVGGLQVKGITEETWIDLPPVLSHPSLPDTRSETASPHIVQAH